MFMESRRWTAGPPSAVHVCPPPRSRLCGRLASVAVFKYSAQFKSRLKPGLDRINEGTRTFQTMKRFRLRKFGPEASSWVPGSFDVRASITCATCANAAMLTVAVRARPLFQPSHVHAPVFSPS